MIVHLNDKQEDLKRHDPITHGVHEICAGDRYKM